MNEFEEVQFHDAYIISFEVNTKTDHFDEVVFHLESENFINHFGTSNINLIFNDCYRIVANMQMWISGKDTIREIGILNSSELLNDINTLHKEYSNNVNEFKHVRIELNSSARTFDIVSKDYYIIGI
jgi:hypothetical protein